VLKCLDSENSQVSYSNYGLESDDDKLNGTGPKKGRVNENFVSNTSSDYNLSKAKLFLSFS